jgi:hypothetical protein
VVYLWTTIRADDSVKCRSIRIYPKCTVWGDKNAKIILCSKQKR